jgi:hypothetical protein
LKTTLENKKKVAIDFPRCAFKRKNRVEEGKALGLRVEREHERTIDDITTGETVEGVELGS